MSAHRPLSPVKPRYRLLTCLLFLILAASALADTPRPMVPEDYHQFRFVSDPRISPDGQRVALVQAQVSKDRRSRESAIWMVPVDGARPLRQFTAGTGDRMPRFSPDGTRLALLRNEDDQAQVFVMPVDGGEALAVTRLRQGSISGMAWLNDAAMLLTLNIDPAVEDPTIAAEEDQGPTPDVRIFSRQLYISEAAGFLDERRRTLWRLDIDSGRMQRLAADSEWNVSGVVVSPDGSQVAFHADLDGHEFDGGFEQSLHLLDPTSGEIRTLETPAGRVGSPVFSPDGERIAFTLQRDRQTEITVQSLELASGRVEQLHDGMALSASNIIWPIDHALPLIQADVRGSRPLLALQADGSTEILDGQGVSISAVDFAANGARVWTQSSETRLNEVWVQTDPNAEATRLTAFNDALLAEVYTTELERFTFTNDGVELDGFVVRPKGLDEARRWPVILNIKGGPAGMWGHQWMHEFQMMAGAGFAVVFTNYRGSTGYGHEFQAAVQLDYGGVDYRDNMAVLDAALERFAWLDAERQFVTGGSHGGFLTNWITTRTDRFAAAVTQRSVSNWVSEAGTQAFPPASMNVEFGGSLWENFDLYWDRSPLQFADRVTTPTLIIHSTDDRITPIGQGQEWFYALLNNGVEAEFALFEGEGHELSRSGTPVNLVKRLELILGWFARFDPGA
ncbi:MAG: prolyl oligopeptidase family serine peptidase [Wenzhouxiangella sp.]